MEISAPEILLLRSCLEKQGLGIGMHFSSKSDPIMCNIDDKLDHPIKRISSKLLKIRDKQGNLGYNNGSSHGFQDTPFQRMLQDCGMNTSHEFLA